MKLKQSVKIITITHNEADQRLDNFLISHLKSLPRSRVYSMIRKGEVRVNKGRAKPSYRLQPNDFIRIPPFETVAKISVNQPSRQLLGQLENSVIYQNHGLLIINKPAGIAVHGGSGVSSGIIETLRIGKYGKHYLELVHRLDKDTSGCLMLATKRSTLRRIHTAIRQNTVVKKYLTLLKGHLNKTCQIESKLHKQHLMGGERMVTVKEKGKNSITLFKPVKFIGNATLTEVTLRTGRTHQIRVHAAHMGHPIAGDSKYGDKAFNQLMKKQGLRRLFLHASTLEFIIPEINEIVHVNAPLPHDLQVII